MKKRCALLVSVLLLFSVLCGCGKEPPAAADTSADRAVTEPVPLTEPAAETETESAAPSERQLYTDYLTGGGYDELLYDYDDPEATFRAESCLADINDDGTKELLLHITNTTSLGLRGYPAVTCLLGVQNGEVEMLGVAFYGAGSGGGDYLFIRYDTVEKKHVLEYEEFARDGMFSNTMAHYYFDVRERDTEGKRYGTAGEGNVVYKTAHTLRSSFYATEGAYASEAEKIMRETTLYREEDGIVTVYLYDGAYISEAEYDAMRDRFVEPTDPAYQMKPVTLQNPVPAD